MEKIFLILSFLVLFQIEPLFSQAIQYEKNIVGKLYNEGSEVLIKAEPDVGYVFSNWEGYFTGYDNPMIVKMDSDITVTAIFKNDDTLLGYWKMDDTTGTVLSDSSVNTNNITLNNSNDSTFVNGKLDGAVFFNGSCDGVISDATNLQLASYTIAVYLKADPSIDEWMWIAGHADNYGLYFNNAGFMEAYQYNDEGWEGVIGKRKIRDGQWHHVAATFDNATKEMKIFIDGFLDNSRILTKPTIFTTGNDFHIGTMNGERFFHGLLDELRLFNRALSQEEISNLVIGSVTQYQLIVNIVGTGLVTKSPDYDSYFSGTEVTLTARTSPNGKFLGWDGDINSTDNPYTFIMDTNKTITAYFQEAASSSYYVSTTGNNDNDGSIDSPWATITYGSKQLIGGDTLIVKAGVYKTVKEIISNSGTDGKYITIRGEEGVIIEGSSINIAYGIVSIQEADYVILDGITVRNAESHGIKVFGKCDNIIIRNCKTEHTAGCGILVQGSYGYPWDKEYYISNILLDNNEIHWPQEAYFDGTPEDQLPSHEDITLMQGVEKFEIRNCYVNAYDAISYHGGPVGIDVKDGVRYGKVHHNTVENIPSSGIYLDAWDTYAHHIDFYNNYVINVNSFGMDVGAERGGPIDSVKVYNNILVRCGSGGILSGNYHGDVVPLPTLYDKTHIDIFNNTIYQCGFGGDEGGTWQANGIFTETSWKESKVYNNIIIDCYPNAMKLNRQDNNLVTNNCFFKLDGSSDIGDEGSNAVKERPQFIDVSKNDFRLKEISPCIDAGIADGAPAFDYDGKDRPFGNGFDIGAYEYSKTTDVENKVLQNSTIEAYPNPFNNTVTISYTLNESSYTTITVFDVFGKQIDVLVNKNQVAGSYSVEWDGTKQLSGFYFYTMKNGAQSVTKKIVLNR